jgi:DNA-binding LacI/PurR family transcriptional regulator
LEHALSQPPSTAGLRLRSERDLVQLLNLNHALVRRSLNHLVEKGVLVRRHGSGTYLRRVPIATRPDTRRRYDLPVSSDMLFADAEPSDGRQRPLVPTREQKQVQIGLWTDFALGPSPSRQALLHGIVHCTEEAGHRVSMHSLAHRNGHELSVRELAERLEKAPSDGYLVGPWYPDRFLAAVGEANVPIIFFQDSSAPISHEPFVFMETNEAIARAVQVFAEAGYARIGLLGLSGSDLPVDHIEKAYDRSMEDAGLTYRSTAFGTVQPRDNLAAFRSMLNRDDPPDALYVADDVVLAGVAEVCAADGIVPGRDLGVITFSTPNLALPRDYNWSRMDFDVEGFGEAVVNSLLRMVETAGSRVNSHAIHASWVPGETHFRSTGAKESG